MGAGGFGDPRRPLHRSHRRDLRPARRRAQHEGRSGQPVHARAARRRPASDHRPSSAPGPVDLFASSGGAVNALALVAKHPEQVRTLVAHEPPLASILPDREGAMALTQAIADTYQRSGFGAGMAQFIVAVSHQGPITPGVRRPAGAGSGDVRAADRGRRQPDRPAAVPEHHHRARTTSPTSTRCARPRPGS